MRSGMAAQQPFGSPSETGASDRRSRRPLPGPVACGTRRWKRSPEQNSPHQPSAAKRSPAPRLLVSRPLAASSWGTGSVTSRLGVRMRCSLRARQGRSEESGACGRLLHTSEEVWRGLTKWSAPQHSIRPTPLGSGPRVPVEPSRSRTASILNIRAKREVEFHRPSGSRT